jgi:adenylyltransferase/sulfurtransferase
VPEESAPIRIDDSDRYDSLRLIPWWDQASLAACRVLVIGAGAIGNEVIKNLALLGVGHIAIVDMDRIEASNLSRSVLFRQSDAGKLKAEVAASSVRELNPHVSAVALPTNVIHGVGLHWFAAADCVLGCLDNREARLWVNRCCWHTGTPWIDAGIQEISGVVQVFMPPDGTCYECGMKEADYRLINLRYSCPLLKTEDIRKGRVPTTPTIASIIAGWQVQEFLKLFHRLPNEASTAIVFHGMTNHVYRTRLPIREDCLSHDPWPTAVELPAINVQSTVDQLFAALVESQGASPLQFHLLRELVTSLNCSPCGISQPLCRLRADTPTSLAICPNCSQMMAPTFVNQIEFGDHDFANRTLQELGIPAADILKVDFPDKQLTFRLAETVFPSLLRLDEEQ